MNAQALQIWVLAVCAETNISVGSITHTLGLVLGGFIKSSPFSCLCTAPSPAKNKIKQPLANQLPFMLPYQDFKCTQV